MLETSRSVRKKTAPLWWIFLIPALAMGAVIAHPYITPSTEIEAWGDGSVLMVVGKGLVDTLPVITDDGQVLMSLDAVLEHIDDRVFWEPESDMITLTTHDTVLRMRTDQLTAHLNQRPVDLSLPVTLIDDIPHLPLGTLSELYGLSYVYHADTSTLVVDWGGTAFQTATVSSTTRARTGPGISNPWIVELSQGEEIVILEEKDGWYSIRTQGGVLAHVPKSHTQLAGIMVTQRQDRPGLPSWRPMGEKIILTWDYVGGTGANAPRFANYPPLPGVNVISPTWFHVVDGQGNMTSLADPAYVAWAHDQGLRVWALVTNGFNPDRTRQILRDPEIREKVVLQILAYAALYGVDGINIDFENMYQDDRDYFSQFVRELAPLAREQGLVVSVDVTAISLSPTWSLCYDRPALAKAADYLILMAYDQHPAASPVAGPVAALDWTERVLVRMLQEVPREQLILGVPFYTRVWTEEPRAGGGLDVSSRAVSMGVAERLVQEKNAEVEYDEKLGLNHAWYTEGSTTYRIWLEDEESIRKRAALVNQYGLPGLASWRRGFEKPEIWEVLSRELRSVPPTGD